MADDKLKTGPEPPGPDRPGDAPVKEAPPIQEPPVQETNAPGPSPERAGCGVCGEKGESGGAPHRPPV